jgi:uncharacterized protein YijF (DUF1287 family)
MSNQFKYQIGDIVRWKTISETHKIGFIKSINFNSPYYVARNKNISFLVHEENLERDYDIIGHSNLAQLLYE